MFEIAGQYRQLWHLIDEVDHNTIQSVICIVLLYNLSRSTNKTMKKILNKNDLSAV